MKKNYISPSMNLYHIEAEKVLMGSQFDSTKDTQEITPTNEEYSGVFNSRGKDIWDDDTDEDGDF